MLEPVARSRGAGDISDRVKQDKARSRLSRFPSKPRLLTGLLEFYLCPYGLFDVVVPHPYRLSQLIKRTGLRDVEHISNLTAVQFGLRKLLQFVQDTLPRLLFYFPFFVFKVPNPLPDLFSFFGV